MGTRWNRLWLAARALGAIALLTVGAVHSQEFAGPYSRIPTIGTLFLLNFVGSTAVGLALLAPVERMAGARAGMVLALLLCAGIALAGVALAFLTISERTPLFGFMEPGYDPGAIATARAAEAATILLLGSFLVARFGLPTGMPRW
jgi:hypothetical protein